MLTIWGRASSANVMKILWCCNEIGIPYRQKDVGGEFGGLDTEEYLAINPNGRIPTVQHEIDGRLFTLWESNSILRYLCAKYALGRFCPGNLEERADAERWMDWQLCHILPGLSPMFFGLLRTPEAQRDHAAIENGRRQNEVFWRILDRHLADRRYLCGESMTMAEFALGIFVYRWLHLPIERPDLPNLQAWYGRLKERPAYQRYVMLPVK